MGIFIHWVDIGQRDALVPPVYPTQGDLTAVSVPVESKMPVSLNAETMSVGFPSPSLALAPSGASSFTWMQDASRQAPMPRPRCHGAPLLFPSLLSGRSLVPEPKRLSAGYATVMHAGALSVHVQKRSRSSCHALIVSFASDAADGSLGVTVHPLRPAPNPFLHHSRRHCTTHLSTALLRENL